MQPTLANRNNNPGNLRDPKLGTFRQFNSPQEGFAALLNDLHGKQTATTTTGLGPSSTLADFAKVYAPASDNNDPARYTANLANYMGVRPDTPLSQLNLGKWAEAVANSEGFKMGSQSHTPGEFKPTSLSTTPAPVKTDESLGGQVAKRIGEAGEAVGTMTTGGLKGVAEGTLRLGGAVGGLVGDVTDKALGLIPGYKQIQNLIGKGAGKLLETESGKAIAKSIDQFTKDHPDLSKDIGAAFNIVTAIPILKGVGAVKNIGLDAVSSSFVKSAEKGAIDDLSTVAARTVKGRRLLRENPEAIKAMVEARAIPTIENGKYMTNQAYDDLSEAIKRIDEDELDVALRSAKPTDQSLIPLQDLRNKALVEADRELTGTGNLASARKRINQIFDENAKKYGEAVNMEEMTEMKRKIRKGVNFNSPVHDQDANYIMGQVFMKEVEDMATRLGLEDVHAINARMGQLIRAQEMLKVMDGKPVKLGRLGSLAKSVGLEGGAIGGEILGGTLGIPMSGTLGGGMLGRLLGKESGGFGRMFQSSILERTGPNAVKQPVYKSLKKVGGLIGASLLTHPKGP